MTCVECGAEWALGPGEREWFLNRNLQLPRRCKPCRERLRVQRESEPRFEGTITFVSASREWGQITRDGGERYFFRIGADAAGWPLALGTRVSFSAGVRWTGRHPRASLVKPAC